MSERKGASVKREGRKAGRVRMIRVRGERLHLLPSGAIEKRCDEMQWDRLVAEMRSWSWSW